MKKTFTEIREDISVPAIGQTFSRELMPQITDPKAFIQHLRDQSISFEKRKIDPNHLKSTQLDFDASKIHSLIGSTDNLPIITSKDNHVLDGHHRWLANYYSGKKCDCYVVDLPILELMRVAKEHTGSLNEELTHDDLQPHLDKFVKFVAGKLKLKSVPPIKLVKKFKATSFGGYNPNHQVIHLHTKNRHPMDVFRTLAHELVHHQQREHGRIEDPHRDGKTGSPIEDEANYMAGRLMRQWGKKNPKMFGMEALTEAVFVVGVPCSGKDSIIRKLQESKTYDEIDIQTLKNKKSLSENVIINAQAYDYENIEQAKRYLEHNGYVTEMVFVNVSNDISKIRNEQRQIKGQRVINEGVRFSKFEQSIRNIEKFDKLFDGNIVVVENLDEACWQGYYQPKKKKLKPKKGAPGQFVPNCVPKKSVKEATNVKDQDENSKYLQSFAIFTESNVYQEDPNKRELGSETLTNLLKAGTPGQTEESCGCTKGQQNEESCTCSKCQKEGKSPVVPDDILGGSRYPRYPLFEKRKIVRKKKLEEDGVLDTASGAVGLPQGDSIGPEFGVAKSPSLIGGLVGVASPVAGMGPAGSLYPFGTYGIAESIVSWATNPKTIQRYVQKYGNKAEEKIFEAAMTISKEGTMTKKTLKQLRESWEGRAGRDSSAIGTSHVEDKVNEDSPAWQRKEGKNPEGGLNKKGVASYRREHPGSKLQTAVTEKSPKGKRAKRRLSFCRRMRGMKSKLTSAKTARDPDSRINKSLRKWNCEE